MKNILFAVLAVALYSCGPSKQERITDLKQKVDHYTDKYNVTRLKLNTCQDWLTKDEIAHKMIAQYPDHAQNYNHDLLKDDDKAKYKRSVDSLEKVAKEYASERNKYRDELDRLIEGK